MISGDQYTALNCNTWSKIKNLKYNLYILYIILLTVTATKATKDNNDAICVYLIYHWPLNSTIYTVLMYSENCVSSFLYFIQASKNTFNGSPFCGIEVIRQNHFLCVGKTNKTNTNSASPYLADQFGTEILLNQ